MKNAEFNEIFHKNNEKNSNKVSFSKKSLNDYFKIL